MIREMKRQDKQLTIACVIDIAGVGKLVSLSVYLIVCLFGLLSLFHISMTVCKLN